MTPLSIDILLLSAGFLLLLLGLLGAFLPVLPGPPLSFLGLLLLHFSSRMAFSQQLLIIMGTLSLVITIADYLLPVWGTRLGKGSRHGVLGATLGMVIGLLFFPPVGVMIGPFAGAWLAERANGKTGNEALRSALGSFLGLIVGIVLKFLISVYMIWIGLKHFILSFV